MAIDRFTREQFERALPVDKKTNEPLWRSLGLTDGEYAYQMPVAGTNKRIVIRSSIGRSGIADNTGENSIRLWVEYFYPKAGKWLALGKLDAWTTRVPGWQVRMTAKLRELWKLALADSNGRKSYGVNESKENKENEKEREDSLTPQGEGESQPPKTSERDAPSPSPFRLGEKHQTETVESEVLPADGPTPNEQQMAAITAPVDAAVRVLAGPGTGKTFVVARRYAHLLANGALPSQIVAVTFNKTMADELLSRISRVNPSAIGTDAEKQVCTIHALCYRMLRAEGDRRSVAKEWQVKRALQDIISDVWRWGDEPGYSEVLSYVNTAKMQGLTTADDMGFFSECVDCYGRNVGRELHETRRLFDERMRREKLLTFSDMLLDVEIKLKTDRTFREKYQKRYQWVIVDEGQDTTAQAMRILTTLAQPQNQFYIVGDADQLLYRFAGATPEANLYRGFEDRYPDGVLVKLETNYRSTKEIIRVQLELIENNYELAGGPYEHKYLKTLAPRDDAPDGELVTFSEYLAPEYEAAALVESLVENLANGDEPGRIFVGARTRAQLGYLEGPLVRAKIPFINIAGGSFWGSKHIADVMAYLRLAYDTSDNESFKRVFNIASNHNVHPWGKKKGDYCHHRYLGRAFLTACQNSYTNVWRAVGQRRSFGPGAEDLTMFVDELQAELAAAESPADVVRFINQECYRRYLMAEEGITDEGDSSKLDDLETVADVAGQFSDVGEFIEYVRDAQKTAEAARGKDWGEYVVLSTVHRLKGLEREIVYGIGLSEGVNMDGSPAGLLPHTYSMTPPPQNGILPTGGMGRIEDERCIAFVLVSRAKERCHLSGVQTYRKSQMSPSRFVSEMRRSTLKL